MKNTHPPAHPAAEQKVNNFSFWALVLAGVATVSTLPYVIHDIQVAVAGDYSTFSGDLFRLMLLIPAILLFFIASAIALVLAFTGVGASDRKSKKIAITALVLLLVINPGLVILTFVL